MNLTAKMHRWKLSALAAAAFVSAALSSTDAAALALGPISVHSALGENLRAEIAIPQITPSEMDSLLATVASPEVFRAQGMDYSASARSINIEVKRNTDGTAKLQLSSSTPMTDPFVDLVLQTNWSSGHLVRSYTLLLDPPASTRAAPPAASAPAAAPAPILPSAAVSGRTYSSNGATSTPAPRTRTTIPASPAAATRSAAIPDELTVRTGQTAGQIASAHRPSGVSLDQMLVAMLRTNPDAFINGNINRIRAGAVVQMPSREQALETPVQEARRIVAAQSRDFNAYRRSLAAKAPTATVQAADRSSSGQVQARVEDSSPAAATSDKLTLSKGNVQASAAQEQQLAEQKQAQDQSDRLNELQRNLTELNQLSEKTTPPPAPAPATSAASEAAPAPAIPAIADTASTLAAAPAIESSSPALTPDATATEPAAKAPATEAPAAPAPVPETAAPATKENPATPAQSPKPAFIPAPEAQPSIWDELQENPLIPAGAAALALLLGLLGYRTWKQRRAIKEEQDPALGDSELHPDSFFGGSGGQQVDTNSAEGATTMAYSPSQLDGGADVDPVAEADVYLAYGRDVQAEEILKEALRNHPERLAVHMKLAEIYAKRQDLKALENTARTMQDLSHGQGADWQRVVTMGRSLDPSNPFYANITLEGDKSRPSFADALGQAASLGAATTASTATAKVATPEQAPEFDLNLDLDLPGGLSDQAPVTPAPAAPPVPVVSEEDFNAIDPLTLDSKLDLATPALPEDPPTLVADTVMADELPGDTHQADGLDFDLSSFEVPGSSTPAAPATAEPEDGFNLSPGFDMDLEQDLTPAPAPVASDEVQAPLSSPEAQASAPAPADTDSVIGLDFDLGGLDLGPSSVANPAESAQPGHNEAEDSLSTKLDLAQEFNAIGDSEGARALIEEVLVEASGPQKVRAQKMLSELD